MNIVFRGQSFFEIQTKEANIAIDPFSDKLGLKSSKTQADILLISHDHPFHNNTKAIIGDPFIINDLGEYEIKGVFIKGIQAFHGENQGVITMFKIEVEGIKICHLSDINQKELTEEQMEEVGEVDILMVPVGGHDTLNAKSAKDIISQIEPRVVIPMHYKLPNLKIELDDLDSFFKQMGQEKTVAEKKFKATLGSLPAEETKIVVLEI